MIYVHGLCNNFFNSKELEALQVSIYRELLANCKDFYAFIKQEI